MKNTRTKNIGASVRARLLRLAREQGEDFQLVLTRYANERLLFRLASSPHVGHFVLKGASLFTLWTGKPHRATRDLDLLGFGDSSVEHVREVFTEVLALDVADDGVCFDLDTLGVTARRPHSADSSVTRMMERSAAIATSSMDFKDPSHINTGVSSVNEHGLSSLAGFSRWQFLHTFPTLGSARFQRFNLPKPHQSKISFVHVS